VCLVALFPLSLPAQDGKRSARKDAKDPPMAVTPEREAAAFTFVERHHPELGELLKHLKESKQTKQYDRAVRDLYSVSERLAGLQTSDKERYELELKTWKLKSRIQLLSARLTMGDSDELKQELRKTLAEQRDVRRELLVLEKQRAKRRADKLEQDLVDFDAKRDAELDKQFQQLTAVKPTTKNKSTKPNKKVVKP
jgi:hypothetical protein